MDSFGHIDGEEQHGNIICVYWYSRFDQGRFFIDRNTSIDALGVFDYMFSGYMTGPWLKWYRTKPIQMIITKLNEKYPMQKSSTLARKEEGKETPITNAIVGALTMRDHLTQTQELDAAFMDKVGQLKGFLHQSIATSSM